MICNDFPPFVCANDFSCLVHMNSMEVVIPLNTISFWHVIHVGTILDSDTLII